MTIHTDHPFADPEPDPVRRLRGHLAATVCLLTAGEDRTRAGLTVTSLVIAAGEPARVLALVDPDSDLADVVRATGRAVVQVLGWEDRGLAEVFAGQAPAPGGAFRGSTWHQEVSGPRLDGERTWAALRLEHEDEVGWSALLRLVVEEVHVGADAQPLVHHRGRLRPLER